MKQQKKITKKQNKIQTNVGNDAHIDLNHNGITLISLVITVVVLLILAGVAISIVVSPEGLFSKSGEASEKWTEQTEQEEIVVQNSIEELDKYAGSQDKTIKNITKNKTYATIEEAVIDSENNDVIEITEGEYDLVTEDDLLTNGSILEINKSITIRGSNTNNKPILLLATSDGTAGNNTITNGIAVKADNVCLENLILKATEGKPSTGNLLAITSKNNDSNDFYTGTHIKNCEFLESDHSIELYGNNTVIEGCVFDESGAVDQGNILVVRGTTSELTIKNNQFIGDSQKKHAISFYAGTTDANNYVSGNILIENNTFSNVYKGIVHESSKTYNNVSVVIKNNVFNNYKKKAVAIDNGSFTSYVVQDNLFYLPSDGTVIVDNGTSFAVDANDNYWGANAPSKSDIFEGSVNATSYYTDEEKSVSTNW